MHLGFVEQRQVRGRQSEEEVVIFNVWDKNWNRQLGFFLENGATFEIDANGEARPIGNHNLQKALELLFRKRGTYRLVAL